MKGVLIEGPEKLFKYENIYRYEESNFAVIDKAFLAYDFCNPLKGVWVEGPEKFIESENVSRYEESDFIIKAERFQSSINFGLLKGL